jgi:Domain of unknown function (DUF4136)
MHVNKLFFPVTLTALAGTFLLLADVKTDYDKSADFAKYHTYSWIAAKGSDDIWTGRIKTDINQALAAKGWNMVESGGDAAISAFGSSKNVQSLNTFYDGLGGGWGWRRGWGGGMGTATTTVENTPVGTLVVDVFDSSTKKLIWRGQSSEELSEKADKDSKKLEKDVEDMFKKFPPQSKG